MNDAGEQILLNRIKSLEYLLELRIEQVHKLETALKRIAGCDWTTIEMDLRNIAREALE